MRCSRLAAEQEVLAIIQQALPGFDAVCMATAAHKMGSLPPQGPPLDNHPAIAALAQAIGEAPGKQELCSESASVCMAVQPKLLGFNRLPGRACLSKSANACMVMLPGLRDIACMHVLWHWGA